MLKQKKTRPLARSRVFLILFKTVLGIAAQVAVQSLDDVINPHKAETMTVTFGCLEQLTHLLQLFSGSEVGE